ncbi:MAG: hypothetical protein ACJZ68_01685 [Limisphaerales bacterium]
MPLFIARWFRACCIALPILLVSQACTTVTHGEVYFQLYVKDRQRAAGPNPHVEGVEFHSFAYRMDDGPKTVLLTD